MNDQQRFEDLLHSVVANGVGQGLSLNQLIDGLTEQLGAVIAAVSCSRQEIMDATEVARHSLDEKVVKYDYISGHPYLGRCEESSPPDRED